MAETARNLEQTGANLSTDAAADRIETLRKLVAETFDALDRIAAART